MTGVQSRSSGLSSCADSAAPGIVKAPRRGQSCPATVAAGVVGCVHAGKQRVAAITGDGKRVELCRLERHLVIRAVRMPVLATSRIDGSVQRTVRVELVDAKNGENWVFWMSGALRRVFVKLAEASAVGKNSSTSIDWPRTHITLRSSQVW